jgi:hypothetical protein
MVIGLSIIPVQAPKLESKQKKDKGQGSKKVSDGYLGRMTDKCSLLVRSSSCDGA